MHLDKREGDACDTGGIHELLKVLMKELKYQVEFVFCVDDISQPRKKRIKQWVILNQLAYICIKTMSTLLK